MMFWRGLCTLLPRHPSSSGLRLWFAHQGNLIMVCVFNCGCFSLNQIFGILKNCLIHKHRRLDVFDLSCKLATTELCPILLCMFLAVGLIGSVFFISADLKIIRNPYATGV